MLARATRPKLTLSVPTAPSLSITVPGATAAASHSAPRSPLTFLAPTTFSTSCAAPPSASPIASALTPTTRNTLFNARGLATLQVPQQQQRGRVLGQQKKRVQFSDANSVRCVSPMPEEYYGEYVKMSREERRWGRKAT